MSKELKMELEQVKHYYRKAVDDYADLGKRFRENSDTLKGVIDRQQTRIEQLRTELEAVKKEKDELKKAIHWALGYTDFPDKKLNEGQYYWRKGLLERSGMTNEDLIKISESQTKTKTP